MSMVALGLTHCRECWAPLEGRIGICESCYAKRKALEDTGSYQIKTMEVGGYLYENIEVSSRQELVNAIEQGQVITIRENGKKIYLNARYIVSFEGEEHLN